MGVENAWCFSTGTGVRVAVIDDGVDITHPDLLGNLLPGYDATGNGSNGAPETNNGHGTNCAGIIASVNNTIGTIGVAFNSQVIPIRMGIVNPTTGTFNTNDTWISNCFSEALNRGADVISNSWGGGSVSAQINAAIQNVITNGRNGRGSVVLFAAGNLNSSVQYPATNSSVIAVGASTPCDTRKRSAAATEGLPVGLNVSFDPEGTSCDGEFWWGSNFGNGLDVLAPGVWITTTDNVGANGFVGGDYNDHFNGTSSACPNTAATAALIIATNPNLTGQEVRNILERTCFKIPNGNFQPDVAGQPNGTWSNQAGYGRINADLAVREALNTIVFINGDNITCNSSNNYTVTNLPNGTTVHWEAIPIGIVTINSPNSTQTTITKNTDGTITLNAIISNGCGQFTISKNGIIIGTQVGGNIFGLNPPIAVGPGEFLELDADISGLINYNWTTQGGTIIGASNLSHVTILADQCPPNVYNGWLNVQVTYENICGTGYQYGEYTMIDCSSGGGSFRISPNPASTEIIIDGSLKNKVIKEIRILDKLGNLKKQLRYFANDKRTTINVSNLIADIYYLQIFDGTIWENKILSVNR